MPKSDDFYRAKMLARKVVDENGCWNWPGFFHPLRGAKDRSTGYGAMNYHGANWKAHRISYHLFKGPIPEGRMVRHLCDNPRCMNPDHLELGDHQQNMDDMNSKGRNGYAKKTHCRKGHEYTPENTLVWNTGRGTGKGRHCRACSRIKERMKLGWSYEEAAATALEPIPAGQRTQRRTFGGKRHTLTKCAGDT